MAADQDEAPFGRPEGTSRRDAVPQVAPDRKGRILFVRIAGRGRGINKKPKRRQISLVLGSWPPVRASAAAPAAACGRPAPSVAVLFDAGATTGFVRRGPLRPRTRFLPGDRHALDRGSVPAAVVAADGRVVAGRRRVVVRTAPVFRRRETAGVERPVSQVGQVAFGEAAQVREGGAAREWPGGPHFTTYAMYIDIHAASATGPSCGRVLPERVSVAGLAYGPITSKTAWPQTSKVARSRTNSTCVPGVANVTPPGK